VADRERCRARCHPRPCLRLRSGRLAPEGTNGDASVRGRCWKGFPASPSWDACRAAKRAGELATREIGLSREGRSEWDLKTTVGHGAGTTVRENASTGPAFARWQQFPEARKRELKADHVEAVFAMLRRQGRRIEFTGGLEALSLQDYQVELLASLRPRPTMFFAYDPGDAFETLEHAARRLLDAGFPRASHRMRVYVLIGFPKDTFTAAETRLRQMLGIGFTPHAMLWRPETPSQQKWAPEESWKTFQRLWARPAIIHARETVPYGRSPAARARVKAARAAQKDDARDRANLRPAHRPKKAESVYNSESDIHSLRARQTIAESGLA
jgi:hypothetical protein